MFIQKNKNKSGLVSIQIVQKGRRKNKIVNSIGVAYTCREESLLIFLSNIEIERLKDVQSLFVEYDDLVIESFVEGKSNGPLQMVGLELILA